MALKNKWTNKIDGVDDVLAEDINSIAESVIELERKAEEKPKIEVDQDYNPLSENPQSGKAVFQAVSPKADTNYLNNNFSNVLKGIVIDTNAVRIDDISPIPHEINVSLEAVNLINQDEFFASTSTYTLPTEVGKTYTFSYVPQEGVSPSQSISEIDKNGNLYSYGFENNSSTITINNGCQYKWDFTGSSPSELYESVSMVIADVSGVSIKTYGKNLSGYIHGTSKWDSFKEGSQTRYAFYIDSLPNATMTAHIKVSDATGTAYLQKSVNGGEYISVGMLMGSDKARSVIFTKTENEQYRIWASSIAIGVITNIQIELGSTATEIEPYKEPVEGAVSVYPTTTLVSDTNGVKITAEYNRDINKAFAELEKAIVNL